MSENPSTLIVELSVEGGDPAELDELTRQLRAEVNEMEVEVCGTGFSRAGSRRDKGGRYGRSRPAGGHAGPYARPASVRAVEILVERKPSTPVKIRVKSGERRRRSNTIPPIPPPKIWKNSSRP